MCEVRNGRKARLTFPIDWKKQGAKSNEPYGSCLLGVGRMEMGTGPTIRISSFIRRFIVMSRSLTLGKLRCSSRAIGQKARISTSDWDGLIWYGVDSTSTEFPAIIPPCLQNLT